MPKLIVLIDNETLYPNLSIQHGLSIWLETGTSEILFDTGMDSTFMHNARALGVKVTTASHLVLSHGHYDHTGGVPSLLENGARPTLLIGPEAWTQRRSSHPIGIPWSQESLGDLPVIINRDTYNIEPGISAVNVGSTHDAALRHPQLQRFVDGHWEPDTFPDEQILMLKTTEGIVAITGCTHCGVDSLLYCMKNTAGDTPIYAIIGGLHLGKSSQEDILMVAEKLRDIKHVWVNHCTGSEAFRLLRNTLGSKVEWAGAGYRAELPPLIQ